jgi:hypothetical protein
MAKDKKDREKQEKIKSIFQQTIATTTTVTAVAVATLLMPRVEASFIDLTVFDDAIYYQLDVRELLDDEEEAQMPELRMNVTNQWDDLLIPLTFGVNEGLIEPLRPGQSYTFSVQMYANFLWTTVASQSVRTQRILNGKITGIQTLSDASAKSLTLEVSSFHTLVDEDAQGQFILRLTYEDEEGVTQRDHTLEERRATTVFDGLPPATLFTFELVYQDLDETVSLDTTTVRAWPQFEGRLSVAYDVLGRVSFILDNARETAFSDLFLELKDAAGGTQRLAWDDRPEAISLDAFETAVTVQLVAVSLEYHPAVRVLDEIVVEPEPTPVFFLSQSLSEHERTVTLTLAWDSERYGLPTLVFISPTGVQERHTFTLLQGEGDTVTFRYTEARQNRSNHRLVIGVPILNLRVDRPLVDTTLEE